MTVLDHVGDDNMMLADADDNMLLADADDDDEILMLADA